MKLIPTTKDTFALFFVILVTLGFFIAGLFNVLDYLIVKAILFTSFGGLIIFAVYFAFKNDSKKNRPEDKLQDDSH